MIAFADMLAPAAKNAGIKVPDDVDNFDKEEFPHWFVFTALQLGASLPRPDSHWTNAHVIANLSEEQIHTYTVNDFLNAGFETGFPIP